MKSVLMPPVPLGEDHNTALGKNKVPQGVKTNESPSEQLTKHEWEQVGNQSICQSCSKDTA